jgi:exosome complex RNA-binding protein Csl4
MNLVEKYDICDSMIKYKENAKLQDLIEHITKQLGYKVTHTTTDKEGYYRCLNCGGHMTFNEEETLQCNRCKAFGIYA